MDAHSLGRLFVLIGPAELNLAHKNSNLMETLMLAGNIDRFRPLIDFIPELVALGGRILAKERCRNEDGRFDTAALEIYYAALRSTRSKISPPVQMPPLV
eukprot:TRINITY_DN3425_c1_g1_i1.p3 TRINITY_DN3425_c1_g1~~TRINITY_DN3425_c1_g1_i1.p3  ORF type:complete len:100 (+),score=13.27 TRINITY_DN3425_c1_g1_i1:480-779(+)